MDIKQIRYNNLITIRDEEAGGSWTELASRVGSAPNYFYQLKPDGKRGLGSQLARRIEGAFSKPRGWMDIPHDHSATEPTNQSSDAAANNYADQISSPVVDRKLLTECITEVESLLLEMRGSLTQEPTAAQKASAITAIYINRSSNKKESVAKSDVGSVFAMLVSNSGA